MTIFLLSAMPGQYDCSIALIEYDNMNTPKRIQFTNGRSAQLDASLLDLHEVPEHLWSARKRTSSSGQSKNVMNIFRQ